MKYNGGYIGTKTIIHENMIRINDNMIRTTMRKFMVNKNRLKKTDIFLLHFDFYSVSK